MSSNAKSHLTESELAALQDSGLSRAAPFIIQGVKHTQLSVARHYGGCTFHGHGYTYFSTTDELIRVDVAKWLAKYRKAVAQSARVPVASPAQGGLL